MNDDRSAKRRETGRRNDEADPLGANSEIGRKLKQYYEGLISEEIPDRFNQLLSQLEEEDQPRSAGEED